MLPELIDSQHLEYPLKDILVDPEYCQFIKNIPQQNSFRDCVFNYDNFEKDSLKFKEEICHNPLPIRKSKKIPLGHCAYSISKQLGLKRYDEKYGLINREDEDFYYKKRK
jgi:hypothetical protein